MPPPTVIVATSPSNGKTQAASSEFSASCVRYRTLPAARSRRFVLGKQMMTSIPAFAIAARTAPHRRSRSARENTGTLHSPLQLSAISFLHCGLGL
jgi:hypothetical protein